MFTGASRLPSPVPRRGTGRLLKSAGSESEDKLLCLFLFLLRCPILNLYMITKRDFGFCLFSSLFCNLDGIMFWIAGFLFCWLRDVIEAKYLDWMLLS